MNKISLKDRCFFVRSNLFEKRNIFLFIILVLVILILLICFNLIFFVDDFQNTNINKNVDMRTLLVYSQSEDVDFDVINNLEHVIYNNSTKFYGSTGSYSEEFNDGDADGYVDIYPLLIPEDINIVKGRSIESDTEAICPTSFYPHSIYINEDSDDMKIYPSYYLDDNNIIGRNFTIKSANPQNEDLSVKIVGLYNPKDNLKPVNGCYISENAYEQIVSPYDMTVTSYYEDGTVVTENIEYSGNVVIVDDYNNVEIVKEELESMGFSVDNAFYIDQEILKSVFTIPLFISLIIIILSLNIIYSFINKKTKYRLHNYGILKTVGYSQKNIISIDTLENVFVFIFSFIVSFLLYIIIYFILMRTLLVEFTFGNLSVHIPFLYIILFIISFVVIIILMCKFKLSKILNQPVRKLLGE